MQHIRVSFLYFGSKIQASIVKIYIKKKKKKSRTSALLSQISTQDVLIITDFRKILLCSLCIILAISAQECNQVFSTVQVSKENWGRSFLLAGKLSGVILNELKSSILLQVDCTAISIIVHPTCSNIFDIDVANVFDFIVLLLYLLQLRKSSYSSKISYLYEITILSVSVLISTV